MRPGPVLVFSIVLFPGCTGTSGEDATTTATATATSSASATDSGTSTSGASAATSQGSGTDTGGADACALLPDAGDCDGAFPRWWFNPDTERCEEFSWGGCNGVVPFEDRASCEQGCEPCEAFDAIEPAAVEVMVSIRNDLSESVFLDVARPAPNQAEYFFTQHYDLDRYGEPVRQRVAFCQQEFSCSMINGEFCGGCDPGPPENPPEPIEIPAMSSFAAESFNGQEWLDTVRPVRCISAQCQSQGISDAPCHRAVSAVGEFTARAYGFQGAADGVAIEASATFMVPNDTAVEVIFQ